VTTRRQALLAGAALAIHPATASASGTDVATLTALVAYQQEVVYSYDLTLARAPLLPGDRAILHRFRNEAATATAALRAALRDEGGTPPTVPNPSAGPPPADRSRHGYLAGVVTVAEDALVARYYAAFQELTDSRHVNGSAAFMAAAGRRLVVLRHLVGDPLLPRAFETGAA
jgi:hypothetical protein